MGASDERLTVRGVLVGQELPSDVVIEAGHVVSVGPAGEDPADIGNETSVIGPPLFDIQVNGAGGINLQGSDVQPEDFRALSDWLAVRGVSHWIPTLVTGPFDDMAHGCHAFFEALNDPVVARAVPGIHLEGPYISPVDGPRGAHPRAHVRPPNLDEFDRLFEAAAGKVAYITVAPEVEGAIPFIEAVAQRGVVVSLGHHRADVDDIADAIDAGAQMCTHLGNGLASQIHRHHNPLWPQLADDRLMASLIADFQHLPPPMLKTLIRAKRPENVILTSDCVHVAGLPPGAYSLAGSPVDLTPAGRVCLSGTDLLAGSVLLLLQGIVNAVCATDMTLEQAYAGATCIPGDLFGLDRLFVLPCEGSAAEMVVFNIDRDEPHWRADLEAVFINGKRAEG